MNMLWERNIESRTDFNTVVDVHGIAVVGRKRFQGDYYTTISIPREWIYSQIYPCYHLY